MASAAFPMGIAKLDFATRGRAVVNRFSDRCYTLWAYDITPQGIQARHQELISRNLIAHRLFIIISASAGFFYCHERCGIKLTNRSRSCLFKLKQRSG